MLWKSQVLNSTNASLIPEISGVYALLKTNRYKGLPVCTEAVYVGKSKNLKRRFLQYASRKQIHSDLIMNFLFNENAEFWFSEHSEKDIDNLEKKIISELRTPFNKIQYKGYNHEV